MMETEMLGICDFIIWMLDFPTNKSVNEKLRFDSLIVQHVSGFLEVVLMDDGFKSQTYSQTETSAGRFWSV